MNTDRLTVRYEHIITVPLATSVRYTYVASIIRQLQQHIDAKESLEFTRYGYLSIGWLADFQPCCDDNWARRGTIQLQFDNDVCDLAPREELPPWLQNLVHELREIALTYDMPRTDH